MAKPKSINELHADVFAGDGEVDRFGDPLEARKKAMDYLARREYGRDELTKKLLGAGFTPDAADAAVQRLGADGLQDDRRFVEAFVRSRIGQGKGPLRMRAELGQRGVTPGVIDDVLAAVDDDWQALARATRQKKFGDALPVTFRDKARQMRFLQYRGFEPEQVRAAVGDADD